MQSAAYRTVLERVFGFSEPVAGGDGTVTYGCPFCGARSSKAALPHAVDCAYWHALPLFDSPVAGRLARDALHGIDGRSGRRE